MTEKQVRAEIRETRAEMKAKGIRRISCFNGGLSGEAYSLNARVFALESKLEDIRNEKLKYSQASELDADQYDAEWKQANNESKENLNVNTPALYEMDSIGVNGALEAVSTHWFCSVACRNNFATDLPYPISVGTDDEWMDGTVCDDCGKPLSHEAHHV